MPEASHDDVAAILRAIMEIVQAQQHKITELEQTLDDLHFVHEQEIASINELLALSFTTREIMRYCFAGTVQELQRVIFRLCYFMPESVSSEVLKLSPALVLANTTGEGRPRDWLPALSDEQYESMKSLMLESDLIDDTFFGEAVIRHKSANSDEYEPPLFDLIDQRDS